MTLSRWLRDYLYIPLGGNRKGRLATYRNLLADDAARRPLARRRVDVRRVGRRSTASGSRSSGCATGARRPRTAARSCVGVGRLVTFHVVCFAWIFFRADSFARAGEVIARLVHGVGAALAARHDLGRARDRGRDRRPVRPARALGAVARGFQRLPLPRRRRASRSRSMLVDTLGPQGVAPFIYFRF